MPSDFTIVQAVRQRFGDADPDFSLAQEVEAPFVGAAKDFPFVCPGVDSREMALLQFESLGVQAGSFQPFVVPQPPPRNILRINGVDIPGGITPAAAERMGGQVQHFWKSHTLLVPADVLREQNVLHIAAVKYSLTTNQANLDNFIIDNVVVHFKLRAGGTSRPPVAHG
ncbi:hypothetical protein [Cumulibacter manganitolerans]|uniref:hypothetical protein n=1 Tax=Cumulibacter manganitolerans TaxID=1884992 RepID=UPI0012971D13|nr:hypothetical protein [Cumulibacter manganitolerans]